MHVAVFRNFRFRGRFVGWNAGMIGTTDNDMPERVKFIPGIYNCLRHLVYPGNFIYRKKRRANIIQNAKNENRNREITQDDPTLMLSDFSWYLSFSTYFLSYPIHGPPGRIGSLIFAMSLPRFRTAFRSRLNWPE